MCVCVNFTCAKECVPFIISISLPLHPHIQWNWFFVVVVAMSDSWNCVNILNVVHTDENKMKCIWILCHKFYSSARNFSAVLFCCVFFHSFFFRFYCYVVFLCWLIEFHIRIQHWHFIAINVEFSHLNSANSFLCYYDYYCCCCSIVIVIIRLIVVVSER